MTIETQIATVQPAVDHTGMTGAQVLVAQLESYGVEYIFGICGHTNIAMLDALSRSSIEFVICRHEQAAAHARRAGSPSAYRAALSLYGGELLPENRYDDWADMRREKLEQLRVELDAELRAFDSDERVSGLPSQASSFVGRKHELRELLALVQRTRLLTLAGAGGAGKTRLALELAQEAERSYADGAALVELASVGDSRLVPAAVAAALEVGALPGRSPPAGDR